MTDNQANQFSRRRFLKLSALGVAAVPLGNLLFHSSARAEAPKVDEKDPMAQQLGYVPDATKADTQKFPKRAGADGAKQFCKNCQLYTGAADAEWGPCAIFPGKVVSANGWCNSWVPKAG